MASERRRANKAPSTAAETLGALPLSTSARAASSASGSTEMVTRSFIRSIILSLSSFGSQNATKEKRTRGALNAPILCQFSAEIEVEQLVAGQHPDHAAEGEEGAEGNRHLARARAVPGEHRQADDTAE